jgi:hypothetical protein
VIAQVNFTAVQEPTDDPSVSAEYAVAVYPVMALLPADPGATQVAVTVPDDVFVVTDVGAPGAAAPAI